MTIYSHNLIPGTFYISLEPLTGKIFVKDLITYRMISFDKGTPFMYLGSWNVILGRVYEFIHKKFIFMMTIDQTL